MKQAQVKDGGRYTAKVSGRLTTVRLIRRIERRYLRGPQRWEAENEATGRRVTVTAAKLRREVTEPRPIKAHIGDPVPAGGAIRKVKAYGHYPGGALWLRTFESVAAMEAWAQQVNATVDGTQWA